MTQVWKTARLGDVCSIDKAKYKDGELPYVGMEDIVSGTGRFVGSREPKQVGSSTFQFTPNHLLYGRLRPYLNKVLLPDFEGHCSSEIFPLLPSTDLDKSFLFYWITSEQVVKEINRTCTGARMPRANVNEVLKFDITIPPIEEQKRIVAILDEAFAGIDTAIANTEKNLANARELFESYLNSIFSQNGEGWSRMTLSEATGGIYTGPFGSLLHKSDYVENEIPLVNPAHITEVGIEADFRKTISKETAQRLKSYIMREGDIVIGRRGEMGRCALVTAAEDGWLCGTGSFFIKSSSRCDSRYLVRLLRSEGCKRRLEKIAGGAVMPNLSNKDLGNFHIDLPPLALQASFIQKIDELHAESQKLETIYQQKLKSLTELKQSLLQKAFSGELTTKVTSAVAEVEKAKTVSPEFTASIIALAYDRHAAKKRDKTFGRVKAQKILHLSESIGGLDLGRIPIKDAAGPNDFKHMLRAENWARLNHFFEFKKREASEGYGFKKLKAYDKLLADAADMTKPYAKTLERIIDLLLPMNTLDAEVFATVHAAWNNLLLGGVQATDDIIIREARENWHPDKNKIPLAKFHNAIRLIRDRGFVPDGQAKLVVGQELLF
jgi:type I restriction enzyme, S subunit